MPSFGLLYWVGERDRVLPMELGTPENVVENIFSHAIIASFSQQLFPPLHLLGGSNDSHYV